MEPRWPYPSAVRAFSKPPFGHLTQPSFTTSNRYILEINGPSFSQTVSLPEGSRCVFHIRKWPIYNGFAFGKLMIVHSYVSLSRGYIGYIPISPFFMVHLKRSLKNIPIESRINSVNPGLGGYHLPSGYD